MKLTFQTVVVLTGAGVSAESGLKTFRGADGWWRSYRAEQLATPEAFARDPGLVHQFYNMRRRKLLVPEIKPNRAHLALAELEQKWSGQVCLITQNVDDLHERAGSQKILHLHGELLKYRCAYCGHIDRAESDINVHDVCSSCSRPGGLRPHVVWFGEIPFFLDEISVKLSACDLFLSVGTSGNVYPAAGFVQLANSVGAHTVELNLEPTELSTVYKEKLYGRASEVVPAYVQKLLQSGHD